MIDTFKTNFLLPTSSTFSIITSRSPRGRQTDQINKCAVPEANSDLALGGGITL